MHRLCEADEKALKAYLIPELNFNQSLLRDVEGAILKGAEGEYLDTLHKRQERLGGHIKSLVKIQHYFGL